MLHGEVTDADVPLLHLEIAGRTWPAMVDTGFNGGLELPEELFGKLPSRYLERIRSLLASGHVAEEDAYLVEFPFDGMTAVVEATFAKTDYVLLGTKLLANHRLDIHFPDRTVLLERVRG